MLRRQGTSNASDALWAITFAAVAAFLLIVVMLVPSPASAGWLEANLGATRPAGAPGRWCGYAMRQDMISRGLGDPGPRFNVARAWLAIGTPVATPVVGAHFVSRGHISRVVDRPCPAGRVATISGNATRRSVAYMCEPISRAIGFRVVGGIAAPNIFAAIFRAQPVHHVKRKVKRKRWRRR